MAQANHVVAGIYLLIFTGAISAMEGGSTSTAPAENITKASCSVPTSNDTFGRYYGDTEITSETLVRLAPEPSEEARKFVRKHTRLFQALIAMPEKLSDVKDEQKRKEMFSDNEILLSLKRFTNLSKLNYAFRAGDCVYKVAGVINKASLIKADNDCFGNQLTPEQWDGLNRPAHTYQTPSSVAYGLLAHQAIDRKGLHGIEIPTTSFVGLNESACTYLDDTNCVVVQNQVLGNLQPLTVQNRSLLRDIQLENMTTLIIEAGLWNIVGNGNLMIRTDNNDLIYTDLEQSNNEKSVNFFHKWPLKRNWNTSVGLEELASYFKGQPEKVDLIKNVAERSGFFARFAETNTKEGLAHHLARLDAFKSAE